jgi:hypothetical protein
MSKVIEPPALLAISYSVVWLPGFFVVSMGNPKKRPRRNRQIVAAAPKGYSVLHPRG